MKLKISGHNPSNLKLVKDEEKIKELLEEIVKLKREIASLKLQHKKLTKSLNP
jgi:hypothetical protein